MKINPKYFNAEKVTKIWLDYYHELTGKNDSPHYDENDSLFGWIVENALMRQTDILHICNEAGYKDGLKVAKRKSKRRITAVFFLPVTGSEILNMFAVNVIITVGVVYATKSFSVSKTSKGIFALSTPASQSCKSRLILMWFIKVTGADTLTAADLFQKKTLLSILNKIKKFSAGRLISECIKIFAFLNKT